MTESKTVPERAINGNTTGTIEARWWQGGLYFAPATPEQYMALEVLLRDLHVADLVDEPSTGPALVVQAGDEQSVV